MFICALFEILKDGLSELCAVLTPDPLSLKNTRELVATWEKGYGLKMWETCRTLSNTSVCMWLNSEGIARKGRAVRMTVLDHFNFFLFEDFF